MWRGQCILGSCLFMKMSFKITILLFYMGFALIQTSKVQFPEGPVVTLPIHLLTTLQLQGCRYWTNLIFTGSYMSKFCSVMILPWATEEFEASKLQKHVCIALPMTYNGDSSWTLSCFNVELFVMPSFQLSHTQTLLHKEWTASAESSSHLEETSGILSHGAIVDLMLSDHSPFTLTDNPIAIVMPEIPCNSNRGIEDWQENSPEFTWKQSRFLQ